MSGLGFALVVLFVAIGLLVGLLVWYEGQTSAFDNHCQQAGGHVYTPFSGNDHVSMCLKGGLIIEVYP